MKKYLLLFLLLVTTIGFAQVGINTATPDASSMLDIAATNKGVLVPRISLANVSLTTLDGTNTSATGLLIWNTNATIVGGNGIGFYFYNGTQWMPITQTASTDDQNLLTPTLTGTTLNLGIENGTGTSINLAPLQDHDWYEVGTTSSPNSINDNIFTSGKVSIGTSTISANLSLFHNEAQDGIADIVQLNNVNNSGNDSKTIIQNQFGSSSGGNNTAIQNLLIGNGSGIYKGLHNYSYASVTGDIYGIDNDITASGGGEHFGVNNFLSGIGSGSKYGSYNLISSTAGGSHYAVFGQALKATNAWAGYFLGNVSIGTTTTNIYTLPSSRGNAGEVLTTDGAGNTSWSNSTSNFALMKVSTSTTQNITSTAKIQFDTVDFDLNSNFNTLTRRFVVTENGYYRINANVTSNNTIPENNFLSLNVRVNGLNRGVANYRSSVFGSSSFSELVNLRVDTVLSLSVGDFIEVILSPGLTTFSIAANSLLNTFEVERIR